MKNHKLTVLIIGIVLQILLLSGCVTGTEYKLGQPVFTDQKLVQSVIQERTEIFLISNNDVDVKLSMMTEKPNAIELIIENKTDEVLVFVTDYSSYSYGSGTSLKLVPEEALKIDSARSQPNITIAPKSNFRKDFYIDSIFSSSLENAKIVFGYKIDGKEKFLVFTQNNLLKGTESPDAIDTFTAYDIERTGTKAGTVKVKKTNWCPLFLSSKENRQQLLYELVLKEAKTQYGENAKIVNVQYQGSWSPLSLILYFSVLGWVENSSATADVMV